VDERRAGRKQGHIWNFHDASAQTVMQLCGECHRAPAPIPDAMLEAPGEAARFAAPMLAGSKCFRLSGGRLSCLSCHNPHTSVSTDLAAYNGVCRSCHAGQPNAQKLCPVNQTSGCVSCHMPTRRLPDQPEVTLHSHDMQAYPPAESE